MAAAAAAAEAAEAEAATGVLGAAGGLLGAGGRCCGNRVQSSGSIPQNQIRETPHRGKCLMPSLEDDRLFFS